MILHPGIIALLTGSLIVVGMLLYGSYLAIIIIRQWDISSSSEKQLALERKTYLVSTIMNFVLAFSILSIFLFIYTVDDIHRLFVGAMCATGSLNANPVGWDVLILKLIIFFLAVLWIAINYIDQRAEDFPLVKKKFVFLLFISPFLFVDTYLQFRYFLGLKPNIITSCCGALFSEEGKGLASTLSGLPIKPMEYIFFSSIALYLLLCLLALIYKKRLLNCLVGTSSLIIFLVSLSAIISFICLYFYEIPTHHCPFDILQGYYNYIGYPLYITLFGGTAFGLFVGVAELIKRHKTIISVAERLQRRWTILSALCFFIFVLITIYPMVFSSFTLEGY